MIFLAILAVAMAAGCTGVNRATDQGSGGPGDDTGPTLARDAGTDPKSGGHDPDDFGPGEEQDDQEGPQAGPGSEEGGSGETPEEPQIETGDPVQVPGDSGSGDDSDGSTESGEGDDSDGSTESGEGDDSDGSTESGEGDGSDDDSSEDTGDSDDDSGSSDDDSGSSDDEASGRCVPTETTLYAGQHLEAGYVSAHADGSDLVVTIETTGDWELELAHLYVGRQAPDRAAPGQFPYHREADGADRITFRIPFDELAVACGETLHVAVHTEVHNTRSGAWETGWAHGDNELGMGWGWSFEHGVCCPTPQ
jgi:hypothetical protein